MNQRIRRGLALLTFGFIALFALRLAYGYLFARPGSSGGESATGSGSAAAGMRRNYASEKISKKSTADGDGVPSSSVDQKYEKVASLVSRTAKFEEDEKRARDLTTKFNALIQFERSSGLAGARDLHLVIGVPPENFDAMVGEIRKLGTITSFRVDKTDKTNEYKKLAADRAALERTRDAYMALKEHGGSIEELTTLEEKILANDQEIQSTGVQLGDYDAENEFCTVRFALAEESSRGEISFGHRVAVALYWTVRYYLILLGILCFGSLCILIVTLILEKLKWIPTPAREPIPSAADRQG